MFSFLFDALFEGIGELHKVAGWIQAVKDAFGWAPSLEFFKECEESSNPH